MTDTTPNPSVELTTHGVGPWRGDPPVGEQYDPELLERGDSRNVIDRYQHVMHHADVTAFVEWARSVDLPIVAIDNMEGAVLIETFDFPQRCVLLFGQEGPGLTAEALAASDVQVEISQFGSTRSLNASAAAAVAMHSWVTQHAVIPPVGR